MEEEGGGRGGGREEEGEVGWTRPPRAARTTTGALRQLNPFYFILV